MAVKRILILTSGFGEGHNAAARNLAAALARRHPCVETRLADPFQEAYPRRYAVLQSGYDFAINHLPTVWKLAFGIFDRTSLIADHIGTLKRSKDHLRGLLETFTPQAVVVTYPGHNHLLRVLFPEGTQRSFRVFTMVTDSITINSVWHTGLSDHLLVANQSTALCLRRAGVPKEKIRVTGFPVPPEFAALREHAAGPPAAGTPWRVLFLINSGRHLAARVAAQLLRLRNVEPVFAAGRDETLRRRLRELIRREGRDCEVHGWVPDLPALMASCHLVISKAGGATVQEALAIGRPMVLTQVVPGQEEGNARLVIENDAGCLAQSPRAIRRAVRDCFANDGELWREWRAAADGLGSADGAFRVADFVVGREPDCD